MGRGFLFGLVLAALGATAAGAQTSLEPRLRAAVQALRSGRLGEAEEAFQAQLAEAARAGRRPGFLLGGLALARARKGDREGGFLLALEALVRPWAAPPGWPWSRAELWREALTWLPAGVDGAPLGEAREALLAGAAAWVRARDPALRLAGLAARRAADPGAPGLAEAWARAEADLFEEELSWRLGRLRSLPLNGRRRSWTWRGEEPTRKAGRLCLHAAAGQETLWLVELQNLGHSWLFAADLERIRAAQWGLLFGLTQGRPAFRLVIQGTEARWMDLEGRLLQAVRLRRPLSDRLRVVLALDGAGREVYVRLGEERPLRFPDPEQVERPAAGIFLSDGELRLRRVRLAGGELR